MMAALFGQRRSPAAGAPAAAPVPASVAAPDVSANIAKLETYLGDLDKTRVSYEKQGEGHKRKALEARAKKDNHGALMYMKRYKLCEKEVNKIMGMSETVEAQVMMLRSGAHTVHFMDAMRAANAGIRAQQSVAGVEAMDALRDEAEELADAHREIEDAMGTSWVRSDVDEADLMAELDGLAEDAAVGAMAPAAPVGVAGGAGAAAAPAAPAPAIVFPAVPAPLPDMPAVPTGTPAAAAAAPARTPISMMADLDAL